jgi:alpha/beta superfamily hydrolase
MSAGARPVTFESDGLRIEGLRADGDAGLAAVVMHPHPQYGGDMYNHVVEAMCEALASLAVTTLRFNFRGTGRSEGSFDNGAGEARDALGAVAVLRSDAPERPVLLVGYSFGAMVAASVAVAAAVPALVLVSPPLAYAGLSLLPDAIPVLILAGDRDDLVPSAALAAIEAPGRRVFVVPGTDHSWWPGADVLASELRKFVANLLTGLSGP